MSGNSRVAVIGAGPAGLTAAYELQSAGIEVVVFEASPQVGGMAKSFELWGQMVDMGPHRFFSSDTRVNNFWLNSLDFDYVMVNRLTRIYYKNKFFSYPIQAGNALRYLGLLEAIRCVLSFLIVKVRPNKDDSRFDYWVINRFGRRLFSIFFKSYTEKLWGIPCKDLDADFAAQRIKKLSLYEAIRSALVGNKNNKHRTLVDEFAYPRLGAGQIYDKLASKFSSIGGKLSLSSPVSDIEITNTGVTLTIKDGHTVTVDHVISTMPLTALIQKIDAPKSIQQKASDLKFRNTILVYLQVEGRNPFPDQWIYVHAENLKTGRITNFRNWTPSINFGRKEHIICLEYWCFDSDEMWSYQDEALINLATSELYSTGLVDQGAIKQGYVRRVPKCYPVYSQGYKQVLQPIQEYFSSVERITPIGRYGSFKYNNQDHSILMGLLSAENILGKSKHDLWAINTDYEYQESSRITSTGLVRDK
ncbi:FAD-dependent oxidoreductase [bacterium]|nr:FAD-dependent oxidoreductase [bacterium]